MQAEGTPRRTLPHRRRRLREGRHDRIEKDPDRRVQEAVALVFRKFAELQTVRQVLVWFRQEKYRCPSCPSARRPTESSGKAPVYQTLHHILTNPVYAGSYAFGRRTARVTIENPSLTSGTSDCTNRRGLVGIESERQEIKCHVERLTASAWPLSRTVVMRVGWR